MLHGKKKWGGEGGKREKGKKTKKGGKAGKKRKERERERKRKRKKKRKRGREGGTYCAVPSLVKTATFVKIKNLIWIQRDLSIKTD